MFFIHRILLLSAAVLAACLPALAQEPAPAKMPKVHYQPNKLVLKLKPEARRFAQTDGITEPRLAAALKGLNARAVKMWPRKQALSPEEAAHPRKVDLSLIYDVTLPTGTSVPQAVRRLAQQNLVAWAEPAFMYEPVLVPNDPQLDSGRQYFITQIRLPEAWSVTTGDSAVIVGIVDSGVDYDHPDVLANVKRNLADPIDGLDNDNDGYVDNYFGIDLAGATYANQQADGNPMIMGSNNTHGSHVGGIVGAENNNGLGVAGVGYNTKIMAIKAAADNDNRAGGQGYILQGYQGIVYAADKGCKVINCSWGGPGFSNFGADVINYATWNKDALVVAAAGNSNVEDKFYPAAYDGVLAVASSNASNAKSGFSNFGHYVGVSAPGSGIYSTIWNDKYASLSGTSMASPVTAGVAALVRAVFPTFTAQQTSAQIKATADTIIYQHPTSAGFQGLLGTGRIDAAMAVTVRRPYLEYLGKAITDSADDYFVPGDHLYLAGTVTSFLQLTSPGTVAQVSVNSPYLQLIQDKFIIGSLGNGASLAQTLPFEALVLPGLPRDHEVTFTVTITDSASNYRRAQSFKANLNPSWVNLVANKLKLTVGSNGRLGHVGDNGEIGIGILYDEESLAFECGIITGNDTLAVPNTVRGVNSGAYDNHFKPLVYATLEDNGPNFNQRALGSFSDSSAPTPVGVVINMKATHSNQPADSSIVYLNYVVKNTGSQPISNYYFALFADWDISNSGARDKAGLDAANRLGYVFDSQPAGYYAGFVALGSAPMGYYAIDNDNTDVNGVGLYNGFSTREKWRAISSGLARNTAGGASGKDVSHVVSQGPFTIAVGDSVEVPFAIVAGQNLAKLQAHAQQAQSNYQIVNTTRQLANDFSDWRLYPNPAQRHVYVQGLPAGTRYQLLDLTGRQLGNGLLSGEAIQVGHLSAGTYIMQVQVKGQRQTRRLVVQP